MISDPCDSRQSGACLQQPPTGQLLNQIARLGGIQWLSRPFHFTLQPIGLVIPPDYELFR